MRNIMLVRSQYQVPDIDGITYIKNEKELELGQFCGLVL